MSSSSSLSFTFDSAGRPSVKKEPKQSQQLVQFTHVLRSADEIGETVTASYIKELTKLRRPLPKEKMKRSKFNW
jgi:predicted RNA-binding protein with PIN domain